MSAGRSASVAAQAKVNLGLYILAREIGGFHQLETLFLRLDLADSIRVRRTTGERSIDVTGEGDLSSIGPAERNLAWRAAELYFAASEMRGGFAIEITKRIPIGGGLGGGSADAGAVLRALDAISEYPTGTPYLMWLAAQLGADVPFLTSEHAYALAWGRGERMMALRPPPSRRVLLVVPTFAVNTASAYQWLAEWRAAHEAGRRDPIALDLDALSDWDRLAPLAQNDFEWMMTERYPEIAAHVESLQSLGCGVSMMTGSGSTVFGVGIPDEVDLEALGMGSATQRPRYILTQSASRVEPVSVIE